MLLYVNIFNIGLEQFLINSNNENILRLKDVFYIFKKTKLDEIYFNLINKLPNETDLELAKRYFNREIT